MEQSFAQGWKINTGERRVIRVHTLPNHPTISGKPRFRYLKYRLLDMLLCSKWNILKNDNLFSDNYINQKFKSEARTYVDD